MTITNLIDVLTVLLVLPITAFVSASLLMWLNKGHLRQLIMSLLPVSYLGEYDRNTILRVSGLTLDEFLLVGFCGPDWISKWMLCPYCQSASVTLISGLVVFAFFSFSAFWLPVIWLAGPSLAVCIFKRL